MWIYYCYNTHNILTEKVKLETNYRKKFTMIAQEKTANLKKLQEKASRDNLHEEIAKSLKALPVITGTRCTLHSISGPTSIRQ